MNTIPRSVPLQRLRVRIRLLSHPRLMSQSTYGDHPDWFRSTRSYDERGAALFGSSSSSSSSGSDYETEEALSQPTTDDGSVENVERDTVPPRPVPQPDRAQSPVAVHYGSTHLPAPRSPRSPSPVRIRYITSAEKGPDGKNLLTQLCWHHDCKWPALVKDNFKFCSRTCGRKVCGSFSSGL